jgi:signal recognition particle GTPase
MSLINNILSTIREISSINEEQRQTTIRNTKRLAEAYMVDMFRAADFITKITSNMDKHDIIKLVMPSTVSAVDVMNEEMNKAFADKANQPSPEPVPAVDFTLKAKHTGWIPPSQGTWIGGLSND